MNRGTMMRAGLILGLLSGGCTLATTPVNAPPPPPDLPPPSSERVRPPPDPSPVPSPGTGPPAEVRGEGTGIGTVAPGAPWTPGTARTLRDGEAHPLPVGLPDEVRALWVVRTALQHPDSIRAVVARAEGAGFNTLLVQVRGRGDAWYRSSIEPRPIQLDRMPADFDPLGLLVEVARPRGLQVHAWINVHLVASHELLPRDPLHLLHARPDWLALPLEVAERLQGVSPWSPAYLDELVRWSRANADQVEGLYSSPANPEVRAHVTRVVEELVRSYPLDGIHLDYVRHPSARFDHSAGALAAFERWLGRDGAMDPAVVAEARVRGGGGPAVLPTAFPAAWTAFRQAQLTALVRDVAEVLAREDPALLLSAAVFPDLVTARDHRFQPWDDWLRSGYLDVAVPMIYTVSDDTFARQLQGAAGVVGPRRVWAGLGIYRDTFPGALAKGRIARAQRAGGVALFSYDWAVGPGGTAASGRLPGGYLYRWGQEGWGVR